MSMVDSDATLLKLLTILARAVEQELNRELRAALDDSLRPAHYAVFRYLAPDGSRIGDLADAAGMTQQSMGELVTHLERRGYVERRVDSADRRARLVVVTDSGRAALKTAAGHIADIERRLSEHLGPGGLADLRRLLARAGTAFAPE
ncbi:MarR family winged helix-turn-helix transcriptional regulator [Nocardia mexicana]|uniref:MarR family transcriptional regulator n=1 Tax=Nocardia mexicana TaxID=279262 RepID=A0A370H1D6_9NOCA|nr:MarR family winged helix-turn-helix transcriptional regulator [Nocardia mexicana]RDI49773.1 MarR family transcriptional regulator [Nocardia mexicana]